MYNPKAKIEHLIPGTRLTVEYFCWRRYFNGIHSSYKTIRQQHGLDNFRNMDEEISEIKKIIKKIRKPVGKARRLIKKQLLKFRDSLLHEPKETIKNKTEACEPEEVIEIRKRIEESYEEGFSFHQSEVKKDPKLLEWVLRENYLGENGKLPA
jgi:uncharacterized protein YydD (DUF2326 family)